MVSADEDALTCDLMETYGILDWRSLPIDKVATFSVGLRNNSRIKMKLSGMNYALETILLANAVDRLSLLVWAKSKDAQKNRNKPKSIAEQLINGSRNDSEMIAFDTPEDFEAYRSRFIKGGD